MARRPPEPFSILCFGDSNTWGHIPNGDGRRYGISDRWRGVLRNELGIDVESIEELQALDFSNPDISNALGECIDAA